MASKKAPKTPETAEQVRDKWQRDFAKLYTHFCSLKNVVSTYRNETIGHTSPAGEKLDALLEDDLTDILDG